MISQETCYDIWTAYREIEVAEKLLADIEKARQQFSAVDLRDSFGRRQGELQLGLPTGDNGHRLFQVEWSLAAPVLQAHIAAQKAVLNALMLKARSELSDMTNGPAAS